MIAGSRGGNAVRPAAVAGRFYPADAVVLRERVRAWLDAVVPQPGEDALAPVAAVIAPHAGYAYSGRVAAEAYGRLARLSGRVSTVILVGPAHFVPVRGVAASGSDAFDTPLGPVPVDRAALGRALEGPRVRVDDAAHRPEHSLEVQLPFLIEALGPGVAIVPLLVGAATAAEVAAAVDRAGGGPGSVVVVSSDLSHYLTRADAESRDAATAGIIEALAPERLARGDACGLVGIRALLLLARARGLAARTLALATSADAGASPDRVVGYGAFAFRPER